MTILLNGKKQDFSPSTNSVSQFLADQGVDLSEMVAVQLNGKILKSQELTEVGIQDRDKIELLYHFGGGSSTQKSCVRIKDII